VRNVSGWGRFPRIECQALRFDTRKQLMDQLDRLEGGIVFARGRSYGDSALASQVLLTNRFDRVLDFNTDEGIITCQSGMTLAEIIQAFLPRQWFLKVTPGTKAVSVGGAIAGDVHGKNHHIQGCFSESVISFNLLVPSGEILTCSRTENPELFHATCGGMGLTGVILEATLELRRVPGPNIAEKRFRCSSLEEVLERFDENRHVTYSVAWIDCLARGRSQGRSILMCGEHAPGEAAEKPVRRPRRHSMPFPLPGFLMNRWSVSLFNHYYFDQCPAKTTEKIVDLDVFFYPLDSIDNWNRLYGSTGFTQYQCVLPKETGKKGLRAILDKTAEAGLGSFLAVLKLLGPANDNMLSFPLEGYTLALDFRIEPKLFPFLERLDRIVLDHGGRLYLSKDVRMPRHVFQAGYQNCERFRALRERYGMKRKFHSLQSKRLGI